MSNVIKLCNKDTCKMLNDKEISKIAQSIELRRTRFGERRHFYTEINVMKRFKSVVQDCQKDQRYLTQPLPNWQMVIRIVVINHDTMPARIGRKSNRVSRVSI